MKWSLPGSVMPSFGLRRLGVRPGERVGIAMRNYPEWLWAFMGITNAGAVAVAMNASGKLNKRGIRQQTLEALAGAPAQAADAG